MALRQLTGEKLQEERRRIEALRRYEKECCQEQGGFSFVIGVDEVGRGPLCGPVVAAACILPEDCEILFLNDSKKLSEARREALFDEIREKAVAYGIGQADAARIDEINILNATFEAMREAIAACLARLSAGKKRMETAGRRPEPGADAANVLLDAETEPQSQQRETGSEENRDAKENAAAGKMPDNLIDVPEGSCLVLVDGNKKIPGFSLPQACIVKGDGRSASIAAASILAKVTRDRMMIEYDKQFPGYGFAKNKGYGTDEHYNGLRALGKTPIHRESFLKNFHA